LLQLTDHGAGAEQQQGDSYGGRERATAILVSVVDNCLDCPCGFLPGDSGDRPDDVVLGCGGSKEWTDDGDQDNDQRRQGNKGVVGERSRHLEGVMIEPLPKGRCDQSE
jgi:hypothetical protein